MEMSEDLRRRIAKFIEDFAAAERQHRAEWDAEFEGDQDDELLNDLSDEHESVRSEELTTAVVLLAECIAVEPPPDCLALLAERTGITLPPPSGSTTPAEASPREP